MRRAFDLYDEFRIDHFRGLAGYWAIAADSKTAMVGKWKMGPREELFNAVKNAVGKIDIIAEDLGVITGDVVKLRKAIGAPGMAVLQFAFGGGPSNPYLLHNHEVDQVVYSGTHDNDTTLGWWQRASEEEKATVRRYFDIADESDVSWVIMKAAISSVARTAIFPMQDIMGLDNSARMNTPATQTTSPHALSTEEAVYGALILEAVITLGLVYIVYATAADPRSQGNLGIVAPLAIGLIVAANVLFAGAFDGGLMNPARLFGPTLVAWDFNNHWVYWVGPLLGGALAGIVYEAIHDGPRVVSPAPACVCRRILTLSLSECGRYLLETLTMHGLAILNGLERFPLSGSFTCYPHRHGASTVDYVMTSPSVISSIQDLKVESRPVGIAVDHALLTFSVSCQYSAIQGHQRTAHTKYTFTPETDPVYVEEIYNRMRAAEPVYTVEEITFMLTEILHGAAKEAFQHTQSGHKRKTGNMPQNSWYDEECREVRAQIKRELTLGNITYKQSRVALWRIVRRKKRAFLTWLEHELYQLFLSRDSSEAWRFFHEQSPPPVITSPDEWGQYAASLYTVSGQPPLPEPIEPCPTTSTFFTTEMVKKAIDKMKTNRAYDHDAVWMSDALGIVDVRCIGNCAQLSEFNSGMV
ncbi:hypothetical protein L7F22_012676 [Adiantum nelumboides]|nr:hypothetical protein [Adiantum nelumboides]